MGQVCRRGTRAPVAVVHGLRGELPSGTLGSLRNFRLRSHRFWGVAECMVRNMAARPAQRSIRAGVHSAAGGTTAFPDPRSNVWGSLAARRAPVPARAAGGGPRAHSAHSAGAQGGGAPAPAVNGVGPPFEVGRPVGQRDRRHGADDRRRAPHQGRVHGRCWQRAPRGARHLPLLDLDGQPCRPRGGAVAVRP